jgi:hypothetical protein
LLDFASTKRLDPRITFSRASTGRFYDGVTVSKAEENLLLQSQTFDSASWTTLGLAVTADATTAPDGTSTADQLLEAATTNFHRARQSMTAGTYFVSVFVKAIGRDYFAISTSDGAGNYVVFDLSSGTVGSSAGSVSGASITAAPNGFYRVAVSLTTTSNGPFFQVRDADSAPAAYAGDATKGVYLWGAQAEIRSAVTAYTATTTQPITNYIPALQTAAAGQARFDHNPTTGESLGLLVEEQRTNIALRSEEIDNASWSKTGASITANTIVAPDGTLTGDKLVEDTSAGTHEAGQSSSVTSGTAYTLSFYAKKGERIYAQALFFTGGFGSNAFANFDLSTGALGTVGSSASASMTAVGNGFYRCVMTATATATTTAGFSLLMVTSSTAARAATYTGDGYSGIFLWGAQLEAGAFATSYIPTTSASATRSADAASMTGSNFSSWYRADEGTVYADFVANPFARTTADRVLAIESSSSDFIALYVSRASPSLSALEVRAKGASPSEVEIGTQTSSGKYAVAYKVNDFAISTNGAAVATDASGGVPTASTLAIGHSTVFSPRFLNGTMKKLSFYPSRLSNAQLIALTQ